MHVAEIVDVGDIDARGIAAPAHQLVPQAVHRIRRVAAGPLQQIDGIRVVVAGHDFHFTAGLRPAPGPLDHHVHRVAGGLPCRIGAAVLVAAAGIDQVRKIEFWEALLLYQVQQPRQLRSVILGHGEADADLDAAVAQQPQAAQRFVIGAGAATEAVMGGADAIKGNADIVVADVTDAVGKTGVDQGAVAGEPDIEAHRLGALGYLEDVAPHQRLAAGQDQHRYAEPFEVVHHVKDFLGRKFVGEVDVAGDRIAVLASQVAASDQVPDHHRPGRLAHRPRQRRLADVAKIMAEAKHPKLLRSGCDTQAGLFQDAGREQNVVAARGGTYQRGDLGDLGPDLVARSPVHHRKQIVGPERQMPWPFVAMGDEIERPHAGADIADRFVADIPHRHAVGGKTERVMVGDGADAPDRPAVQQALQARQHVRLIEPELRGQRAVRLARQRQACLGRRNELPIDGIQHVQTSTRKPMKNSRAFGMA